MINLDMTFIHFKKKSGPAFSLLTGIILIALALALSMISIPLLLWLGFESAWSVSIICLAVAFFLFGFTCCYRAIEHQQTWGQFCRSLWGILVPIAAGVIMYRIEMAAIQGQFHPTPTWGYILGIVTGVVMAAYLYHAMRKTTKS